MPFENQLPERLDAELRLAENLGVKPLRVRDAGFDEVINQGTIKWAVTLLNKLIQQDAAEVKDWLRRVESDEQEPPAGFNWLGLAEAAAFDAQSASDLAWAEVAIRVYERLAESTNPRGRESLMLSSKMLRAAMIAKLGAVPDHPILDLDQIICWFERSLTMSYQEATEKAANWRKCNPEEIRELRRIKNRLQVISVLADSDKYSLNPELKAWLELREKLP